MWAIRPCSPSIFLGAMGMVLVKVLSLLYLLIWPGKDAYGPGTVGMKMSLNEYGTEL